MSAKGQAAFDLGLYSHAAATDVLRNALAEFADTLPASVYQISMEFLRVWEKSFEVWDEERTKPTAEWHRPVGVFESDQQKFRAIIRRELPSNDRLLLTLFDLGDWIGERLREFPPVTPDHSSEDLKRVERFVRSACGRIDRLLKNHTDANLVRSLKAIRRALKAGIENVPQSTQKKLGGRDRESVGKTSSAESSASATILAWALRESLAQVSDGLSPEKPSWDDGRGCLSFGGAEHFVKSSARNCRLVLGMFQEHGWPNSLPSKAMECLTDRQRHETAKTLNHNRSGIRFNSRKKSIGWEAVLQNEEVPR